MLSALNHLKSFARFKQFAARGHFLFLKKKRLWLFLALALVSLAGLARPSRAASGDAAADRVIGQPDFSHNAAGSLNLPQSTAVDGRGNLYIADFANHRVLEYDAPLTSGKAPNRVFGQPDLSANTPGLSDHNFNAPAAVAVDASGNLWVADAGNNRVLEFDAPLTTDALADRVFGQPDMNSAAGAGLYSLNYPIGLVVDAQGNLYVAAWRENRVLEYNAALADATPDRVYGQPDFTSTDGNHGGLSASSLSEPSAVTVDFQGSLYVSDFGNNRVLEYDAPLTSDASADRVFGQPNFTSQAPNNGGVSANSLANPTGVVVDGWDNVYIADPTNNRVLEYDSPRTHDNTADHVIGQPNFSSAVPNNGGLGAASLYFPRQMATDVLGNLYVTDTNNQRVLEYDLPVGSGVAGLSAISPDTLAAGGPAFTLTVNGVGFLPGSVVRWNNSDRPTTYLSSNQLNAAVSAGDAAGGGPFAVTVFNPGLNGGVSNGINLTVYARAWLDTSADGVLGQPGFTSAAPNNALLPGGANRLDHPAASVVDPHSGRLFVADYNNNRVLSWPSSAAFANGQAADLVIGHPDFATTACGLLNAFSVCLPSGVALDAQGELFVADSGNNRVLVFSPPFANGMAASRVIGQPNFNSFNCHWIANNEIYLCSAAGLAMDAAGTTVFVADPLRGQVFGYPASFSGTQTAFPSYRFGSESCSAIGNTTANCLRNPRGVALDQQGNVYVADAGNNRVVEYTTWTLFPAASRVFGQGGSFIENPPNNGGLSADSLNFPTAVTVDLQGNLYVADQSNNRILEYDHPAAGDTTADRVFGQGGSFTTNLANKSGLSASSLDLPFSVTLDRASGNLYAADFNNSRLLEFDIPVPYASPSLTAVSPSMLAEGGPAITLTANGAGFVPGSIVRFNGSSRPTTFLSSTQLNAALSAADVASGGPFAITVINPAPSGSGTAPLNLNLYPRTSGDTSADGVLGQPNFITNTINNPLLPGAASRLDSPIGVALDPNSNRLFVVDTAASQIKSWANSTAFANGQPADVIIGHPNNGSVTAASLANPVGAALDRQGNLYVADWANNRVLEYSAPLTSTSAAQRVFGQPDFSTNLAGTDASSLSNPSAVAVDDFGNLYVVDIGNNRVLVYRAPLSSGMPASLVFGQGGSFTTGLPNKNGLSASSLNGPYSLAVDHAGHLYVADGVNNRILEYDAPLTSDVIADRVFGQANFTSAASGLGAASLNGPMGVALDERGNLYIADNGNNRLLQVHQPLLDQAAAQVFGQFDFNSGAPNGPNLSSLSLWHPIGLAADRAGNLYVADYANRRVLEYDIPIPNDIPSIDTLSPSTLAAGGPDFILTAYGGVFGLGSTIRWNDSDLPTTYIDANHLTAAIPAAWVASGGPFAIRVFTPPPGGGVSLPVNLSLYSRLPRDRTADGVLGQPNFTSNAVNNLVLPSDANRLAGPGGVVIDSHSGRLFVADSNNLRILSWPNAAAFANGQAADLVIGKPDFQINVNQGGPTASNMEYTFGIALDAQGNLYAADSSNNRVLVYLAPLHSGMPASRVFGQYGSFSTKLANNGGVSANSLSRPVAVALDAANNLYVVDQSNHRVLEYDAPLTSDTSADRVFGQPDFTIGAPNNGGVSGHSLKTPAYAAVDSQGNLYVADALNARVLEYDSPLATDTNADHVFGQPDFSSNTFDNGGVSAASLGVPTGLAVDRQGNLYIADSYNARVLKYFNPLQMDGSYNTTADQVFGQPDFSSHTDNNGGVSASSLSANIEGLAVDAPGNLFVVDQLNFRVLEYDEPLTDRVVLSPAASVQAGAPGQVMLYTLQVTNTTLNAEIFQLGLSTSAWPTILQSTSLPLEAGAHAAVTVKVTIPLNAQPGAQNHLTLIVRSQLDPSSVALAGLTTIVGAQVAVTPNAPAVLTYTDPQNQATTLQVPAGAVGAATDLIFTPVTSPANPSVFSFAGHAFNLEAYQNNQLQSPFTFTQPVVVTIHYTAGDIAGLDPNHLTLLYWNKTALAWQDAACGAYVRNLPGMAFSVPICHLSDFAVFEHLLRFFLPLVNR